MSPPAAGPAPRPRVASFGIAATIMAIPGGVALLNPGLAAVLYTAELTLLLVVLLTAVFAPRPVSERAFRLLRWMTGNPEPAVTASAELMQGADAEPGNIRLDDDPAGSLRGRPRL